MVLVYIFILSASVGRGLSTASYCRRVKAALATMTQANTSDTKHVRERRGGEERGRVRDTRKKERIGEGRSKDNGYET